MYYKCAVSPQVAEIVHHHLLLLPASVVYLRFSRRVKRDAPSTARCDINHPFGPFLRFVKYRSLSPPPPSIPPPLFVPDADDANDSKCRRDEKKQASHNVAGEGDMH